MSRQFDAKQYALKTRNKSDGVELFLSYLGISEDEFEYSEGMPAEEYIYGKDNVGNITPPKSSSEPTP